MKLHAVIFALLVASPLAAQFPDTAADRAVDAALQIVGNDFHAVNTHKGIWKLPSNAIAVARRTIGGAPEAYRSFADDNFGSVIAAELLDSYGVSGPAARFIERTTVRDFRVLPLEEFEAGAHEYNWQRLNEKYPDVRYVIRVSWPVVDRPGTYAIVRYELIGQDGPEYASMAKFEKQNNGEWKGLTSETGDIWK
ncbi:MAG: hypothetical protein ACYC7A_22690 [Thermoanaerobaculia bacterium]